MALELELGSEVVAFRLAAIFEQVWDDCYNLESIFKFLAVAGTLIDRSKIKEVMELKYADLIKIFNDELDTVKIIYDEGVQIDKYFPPVAGAMYWYHKLKGRIQKPGEDFKSLLLLL